MPRDEKPPTPVCRWPVNTYWQESPQRVSEHWYISFCLMASAIQDFLSGSVLRDSGNLNWAVTCRYYSMVHTGRLLSFITVGDFPTQHRSLQDIYDGDAMQIRPVGFDWLSRFPGSGCSRPRVEVYALLAEMQQLAKLTPDAASFESRLQSFGRRMPHLASLRNDSNYEALLIAHEQNHIRVTDLFRRMEKAASVAASEAIELSSTAYCTYMEGHPLLEADRATYLAASNHYVQEVMKPRITAKLAGNTAVESELESLARRLGVVAPNLPDLAQAIHKVSEHVKMAHFSSKRSLFDSVRDKVATLEDAVGPSAH